MKTRFSRSARVVALVAVLGLTTAACGDDSDSTDEGAASGGAAASVKLGFMGDLTGSNKNLGINVRNAAALAIEQYNATNPATTIELLEYDSQGLPNQATSLAPRALDEGMIALIGPGFSGETDDTGDIWEEAKMPFISASATQVDLADNGWTTFHRILAADDFQGPAVADFMLKALNAETVAVIDDASVYGKGLADVVAESVASGGAEVEVQESVAAVGTEIPNYSSVTSAIKAADVDAVFYSGYYAQSGAFAKQLKDGGVTASFVSGDGSLDPAFVEGAGAAADGSYLSCACAILNDSATGAQGTFFADYKARWGVEPSVYSPEGYDAATLLINAIKEGNTTSEDILTFLSTATLEGVSKDIAFEANGNVKGGTILMYKVVDGKITLLGTTDEAKA